MEQPNEETGGTDYPRWLQTTIGDGYVCKDRSGKLDDFEEPDLSKIINKLGFTVNVGGNDE
jgi:hypothetical protein